MKAIFRTLAIAATLSVSMNAAAQDTVRSSVPTRSRALETFIEKTRSSKVSFDYTYSAQTRNAKLTGEGFVHVQDNAFHLEGNGFEMWCDGEQMWTIDWLSEEALVENVEDSYSSYSTNPALLVTSVEEAFEETSSGSETFGGKRTSYSVLTPLEQGHNSMDLKQVKLYFTSGGSDLAGAEVILNDGTVSIFTITGLVFSPKDSTKKSFRFDESSLGSSFVVTDLR